MGPLPYPHRATFLASTLHVDAAHAAVRPHVARLLSVIVFDHLVRHPVVTLGDHDDERIVDETGALLDARHPQIGDGIDWFFRVSRRHEVLWFELWLEPDHDRGRQTAPTLRARTPSGAIDQWSARTGLALSHQLAQCVDGWLASRRLARVGPLPAFSADDLRRAAERLARADARRADGAQVDELARDLVGLPAGLAIPALRALGELARGSTRAITAAILELDPAHPVARRNAYVAQLLDGAGDRRAILPLVDDAPMYAKPHLAIWGEAFPSPRAHERMGVRHQGIAASLMPANPHACHNYSRALAEDGRREESYRWADRATVAAPELAAAHLDCVRRLRQVGRPGQAFAEAQYRCREILDRAAAGTLSSADEHAPHHAALLLAFAHLDVGRLTEAIALADDAMARLPADPATLAAFAWAHERIAHWKTDAGLLARAYAWEGHHRGDPGRVIAGLARARITNDHDAAMLIEALIALGRADQAAVAYRHCAGMDGHGVLGDGKARLAAARALILTGELDEALDQLLVVQLRRSQSRLEAELNRVLRLAAIRPAADWERAIERRLAHGAHRLAQLAARDLADFVPGLDTPVIRRALGPRTALVVEPAWIAGLREALPAVRTTGAAIVERLARPADDSLAAADTLAQEWWTALVPLARDREAHAQGAVLALGIALVGYVVAASGPPTPIAGAYRHIATEALHLVRRARYQLDVAAIGALLRVVDALGQAPEWLLDTWLLRIERALDLEAEHGAYLAGMIEELPTVRRLLRGDERIGWELRLATDLARDPSQYEPAATLFARCARAVEAGGPALAWSTAAAVAAPAAAQLDIHWLAALSNPTGAAAPWLRVARGLLEAGHADAGLLAACRGMAATAPAERAAARAELAPAWNAAGIATPLDGDAAFEAGRAAVAEGRLVHALPRLRWAAAVEPEDAKRAQSLAAALARLGHGPEAIQVLTPHERADAPRLIGRVLADAGHATAVPVLRYASTRFRTGEDWAALAAAARRADDDAVTVEAGRQAFALGEKAPELLVALATSLYRVGDFVACEQVAHPLLGDGNPREVRAAGLHAMARALAGQGRHVDAFRYARAAAELAPDGELAAELRVTLEVIVAQHEPPLRANARAAMERRAYADLEAGAFDQLAPEIASRSWIVAGAALAACELRADDESGIPVATRALDAAVAILGRTAGTRDPQATLARVRALRIRDNAFIQIDPPPPLGARFTVAELERAYAERARRSSAALTQEASSHGRMTR